MRIMEHKKLLYLDADLDTRLRELAAKRHESVSANIRTVLRVGLAVIEGKLGAEIVEIYLHGEPPTPEA